MTSRRCRWPGLAYWLSIACCAGAACVSHSYKDVGGGWAVRWDQSPFPEAGGRHPYLIRDRLLSNRVVQENCYHYRYLGDDCVVYSGVGWRDPVFVACGERRSVQVAPRLGLPDAMRLEGDPMRFDGAELSVAVVKAKGLAAEEMFPAQDLLPLGSLLVLLLVAVRVATHRRRRMVSLQVRE